MKITCRAFVAQAALGSLMAVQTSLHAAPDKMPQIMPFAFRTRLNVIGQKAARTRRQRQPFLVVFVVL